MQSSQGKQLNMLLPRNLGRLRERRGGGNFHGCSCIVLTWSRCAYRFRNWNQSLSWTALVFSVRVLGGQAWTMFLCHNSHGKGAARNKPICSKIGTIHCLLIPVSTWSSCATSWTSVLSSRHWPLLQERSWQHTPKHRATGTIFLHRISYCTLLQRNLFPFYVR